MKTRDLILTALFAALTAIGAFLRVPTPISSFTLQMFFTFMAGVLLGPRLGALSQAIYVVLGLAGLPIFTGGGGLGYVLQPTFGFLLGLIPMAAVTGALSRRLGHGFGALCLSCLAGVPVLYLIGLPYMHLVLTLYLHKAQTIGQTLMGGMVIFLPWDALKIVAAAALGHQLAPRLARAGGASTAAARSGGSAPTEG
ncbi:MAG: ECF transporter S component [Oscillospiraceae bacterium]|nr:ECF transporter S component [Oscillospiraceae bacterium]